MTCKSCDCLAVLSFKTAVIVIHLRSSYEVMFLMFLLFSLSVCIVSRLRVQLI